MKRFYNNTIMSGAFSKVLRVFALLCVLFGMSGTAWGDEWLVGSFNNWTANDDTKLESNQNRNSYQIVLEQSETLQEFLIKQGSDTYFGADAMNQMTGDSEWRLDKSTNVYLKPTVTGPYTFFLKRWDNTSSGYKPVIKVWYPAQEIYVIGEAATNWSTWEKCTGNGDIISVELKKGSGKFKFSNTNAYNNEWYQCQYRRGESIGATLSGNRGDDITVNLKNGYGSPVYFKYNKKTGYIWVEATKGGGGDESDHTYALAGTFNNWSTTKNMCTNKAGKNCVQELELTKGSYEFKVVKDGSTWYGEQNDIVIDPTNSTGVPYTTNNTDGGAANIELNAQNDGIYTFTITETNEGMNIHVAYAAIEEPVLISHKPVYDAGMQNVDLFGYVQKTLCNDVGGTEGLIVDYGFVICPGSATAPCNPTIISQKLIVSGDNIPRGTEFTYKVNKETARIIANTVYGYRAYVVINGKMYLSKEVGTFMLPGDCNPPAIDNQHSPIVFTIDASLGETYADDCNLIYGSLQTALDRLLSIANEDRADEYQYTKNVPFGNNNEHNSINLQVPIIFNVMYFDNTPEESSAAYCYQGNVTAGVSGGGTASENSLALIIKDINRDDVDNPYTLTIQNGGTDARPWLHHVIIRNSRNVVLDNLAIFSDPTGEKNDDALEFDINTSRWDALGVGEFTNSKIVVKNCMIGSNGFTGVHASAYDGITFENNEFEVVKPSGDDTNVIDYGASAKFIACSNIKFIRNNFRGAHATLLWIQDSHDALFINNVFWNTNEYAANASAIRLVNQFANMDVSATDQTKKSTYNLGFYYNTFFLQDDKVESTHQYDFLHYSSLKADNNYPPKFSDIEFMYNNCYSYDTDVAGKYQDPTSKNVSGSVYCPNNFWSEYDVNVGNTNTSAFAFGSCKNEIINVKENVCTTTATGPASLVVNGTGLNKGVRPTTALAVALGVPADYVADRYNDEIRPEYPNPDNINNAWTFGAYQSQSGVEVSKIYWLGLSENWDDRNNWGYYPSENQPAGKSQERAVETIQRLSCINVLSEDLYVVIPEKSLLGMSYVWPNIPEDFDADERQAATKVTKDSKVIFEGIPANEQVTAGGVDGKEFAHTIELEYGAAIKGVEHLAVNHQGGKTKYYGNAKTNFSAIRSQWILVGTVVRPWDETLRDYRDIKSGDYYIPSQLPHVYMHEAVVEGKSAKWDKTFTSLEVPVPATKVFAITIPDQYGKYKIAAKYYNKYYGGDYDANDPINYVFTGEFVNDTELPSYKSLTAGQPVLLNNSYPANIDAKKIVGGSVLYYNYDAGSFMSINAVPDPSLALKPQHGFLFIPNSSTLTIEEGWIMDGTTRTRSGEYEMPVFSLNLYNANTNKGYSNVAFGEDEFLAEGEQSFNDTEKIFASSSATPELYIILNDGQYSYVEVPSNVKTIPLGVRLAEAMNIRFEKAWFRGFTQVILVDTKTGKEYNLLEKSYTTETLEPGDIEGRFYINIEEAPVVEEPEEGGDISTEVEENIEEAVGINIYVEKADNTVKVVTNGVELKEILVSDMAGRTITYQVGGYSASLKLPVPIGVYMINVIGDKASRTEKVILK
ncbi:MAG: hypothetical protein IKJ22_02920 [Paludibacteraceae bacterium]|nr:hypothetical protein [Paludibacteraceae bacterium]